MLDTVLAYMILGGLVSSLFLSPRATAAIFAITCVVLQALYYPFNVFSGADIFRAIEFAFIVGVLVVVATSIRERHVRQIKKQTLALEAHEESLAAALESTNESNANLRDSMRALEQSNQEMTLLAELGDLLQACATTAESYQAIGHVAPELFPGVSGALFVYSASRDDLEVVVKWGDIPKELDSRSFKPDQCWALRLGRAHEGDGLCMGLPCESGLRTTNSMCVPMMAHGETLGVLYLLGDKPGGIHPKPLTSNKSLVVTTAEHIALALANLRLRETLRSQSIRDALTGLFNRRFMEETLAHEIKRAERNHRPLGVIMLDLDHFKQFNDSYGHEAGDTLLRGLGEFLKMSIRGGDVACRFGGEEFIIVLPEIALKDIQRQAEVIRQGIRDLTVVYHGQSLGTITASLGAAVFPDHATTVESLLRAADRALYRAKAEGRDRVIAADSEESDTSEEAA